MILRRELLHMFEFFELFMNETSPHLRVHPIRLVWTLQTDVHRAV